MPTLVVDANFISGPPLTGRLLSGLFDSAATPLCRAVDASPDGVTVALLYQGELADSSQVFVVRDAGERPIGIVQLSAESTPGMVSRAVARARQAATCLGPALGQAVLVPLLEGEIEGRSYAVMPYCLPFSSTRWRWWLERLALRPVLLDWLRGVAQATCSGVPEVDVERRFRRPLEQLRALEGASQHLVAAADTALSRLADGRWRPRHVLMHADLWRGNLLLRSTGGSGTGPRPAEWSQRLAVIDWAGAQTRGYAFFDLVRAAESLRVGPRRLRAEVAGHCAIVGCEPVDAPGCVLAAAGAILDEIEQFPVQRLLAMTETSLRLIDAAVKPAQEARRWSA